MNKIENKLTETDYNLISDITIDFTGAELEAVVGEVIRRLVKDIQKSKHNTFLDLALFKAVLQSYKPPAERRRDYKKMEMLAIEDVSFIDMLPEKYRKLREQTEVNNING